MDKPAHGLRAVFLRARDALEMRLQDKSFRTVLLRYLLPVLMLVLVSVAAALPIVAFKTGKGLSDPRSLWEWHHVLFWGTSTSRGAYHYLKGVSGTTMDVTTLAFHRAVGMTYVVGIALFVIGAVLTLLITAAAVYLLFTGENDPRSRMVGRIFRVLFGNRGTLLVAYALVLAPFLFPHLLSYYYSAYLLAATVFSPAPLDPLWIALLCILIDIWVVLSARRTEMRSPYDLFRVRELRVGIRKASADDVDWEDAVHADAKKAKDTSIVIYGIGESVPTADGSTEKENQHEEEIAEEENRALAETGLYDRICDGAGPACRAESSAEKKDSKSRGEDEARRTRAVSAESEESEIRESLLSLFEDDEPSDAKRNKKNKKRG
jgi:hypothetical protein